MDHSGLYSVTNQVISIKINYYYINVTKKITLK